MGIIGVVAAITMPVITSNVQKVVLRNQLKNFVSTFHKGIQQVKVNLNSDIQCYYWDKNPYGSYVCAETDKYGGCLRHTLTDGSNLPEDYNGKISECKAFDNELFGKVFQVAKFCEKNALANGCLSNEHKGTDKVNALANPDKEYNPNGIFSDSQMKNQYPVWVLADSTIVIRYYTIGNLPLYAVDVNGFKGPNKWGHDIHAFQVMGNNLQGITTLKGSYQVVEKGGTNSITMFNNLFSE